MDKIIGIYNFLKQNKEMKDKIVLLSHDEYAKNEAMISASYALVKKCLEMLSSVNRDALFAIPQVDNTRSKLISLEKYLSNDYAGVNTHLIYDFLKLEYDELLTNLKSALSL